MIYSMLTNLAYAGAYAYGKTEMLTQYDAGEPRQLVRRKPRERWLSFIPGAHDGYMSWEGFVRIQAVISENLPGRGQIGAGQRGLARFAEQWIC